jgi:hypothetical protein
VVRRFVFCAFWFAVLWLALSVIGAGVMSSHRGTPAPTPDVPQAAAIDRETAADFRSRYGWIAAGGAAILTVVGA